MIRRININAIKDVAMNLEKYNKELSEAKNKLNFDVRLLDDAYKGVDANVIKEKYQERIDTLNKVITNYFNYTEYLKKVSGVYNDNINSVRKNLISLVENKLPSNMYNNGLSFDTTFSEGKVGE